MGHQVQQLSPDQVKTSLLTEHFRFTPITLLDEIINTVNQIVFEAINGLENSLLETPNDVLGFEKDPSTTDEEHEAAARTEIETGIVQLESLLNSTIDKDFDKLEIYTLRNLLTVSNKKEDEGLENWVVLDHYKDITAAAAKGSDGSALDALAALRREAAETDKLHCMLKTEVGRNQALLARLKPMSLAGGDGGSRQSAGGFESSFVSDASAGTAGQDAPSFSFLSGGTAASELDIVAKSGSQPLTQNLAFLRSQLPALKKLMEELRPHVSGVPEAGKDSEKEKERQGYIENVARKAAESNGIVVGKDDAGGGRVVSPEEVLALERIANALGGSANDD